MLIEEEIHGIKDFVNFLAQYTERRKLIHAL